VIFISFFHSAVDELNVFVDEAWGQRYNNGVGRVVQVIVSLNLVVVVF
jgi:hypothetical protein